MSTGPQWHNDAEVSGMYYGMGESDGLSDLAAFEMGQMGAADPFVYAPGPSQQQLIQQAGTQGQAVYQAPVAPAQPSAWTPDAFAKIGGSIQDVAKTYAENVQARALMKYGPRIGAGQQAMPGGMPMQPAPAPMRPGMKAALVIGAIGLGGLALWYFLKKRPTASNPCRNDDDGGWNTIGD